MHLKFTIIKETIPITWCKQWIKDTDLAKFAEDTDFHSFGEKLEDFLKKAKGRHQSLQALKPKTNYPHASAKRRFHEVSKNDRLTKRPMVGHVGFPRLTPQVFG